MWVDEFVDVEVLVACHDTLFRYLVPNNEHLEKGGLIGL